MNETTKSEGIVLSFSIVDPDGQKTTLQALTWERVELSGLDDVKALNLKPWKLRGNQAYRIGRDRRKFVRQKLVDVLRRYLKYNEAFIRELPMSEFRKLPAAFQKESWDQERKEHQEWMKNVQRERAELRKQLTPHNDSEIRWLAELREFTGLDFDRLQDGFTLQGLEELTREAIEKRKESWPIVSPSDCKVDRATLKRHAEDPNKPWIMKAVRGKYRIHPDFLTQYIREGK